MTQINLPYNLTEGTKAIAAKVMANFNTLVNQINNGAGAMDIVEIPGLSGVTVQSALEALKTLSDEISADLGTHKANTSNPHSMTKAQLGLGNCDNTSDLNKPLSTAAIAALALKANDNIVVKTSGNQTVAGVKTFSDSPVIPMPVSDMQAAPKKYLDEHKALSNNPHNVTAAQVGAYAKTQLQNSGQAAVHWGNLTNVPNLADASWKAAVATPNALPVTGNTLGDQRVVLNDGDGKSAVYVCIATTGSQQWSKIGDVDWASEEDTRVAQESARTVAESARVNAESLRVGGENSRVSAEGARVSAEGSRFTAEGLRSSSESARIGNENTRNTAENARSLAENTRNSAEQGRIASENARTTAEGLRVDAEVLRAGGENIRVSAESNRAGAEGLRVSAEGSRAEAEEDREAAETARQEFYAASGVWENYNNEKPYVPGNKVSYEGGSYLNIIACTGVLPSDSSKWLMIASKGAKGDKGDKGDSLEFTWGTGGNENKIGVRVEGEDAYTYGGSLLGAQGVQGKGYNPRGQWVSLEAYVNNETTIDTVLYNGSTYYCKASVSSATVPASDTVHWGLMTDALEMPSDLVTSVNGKSGDVVLGAEEVGALPKTGGVVDGILTVTGGIDPPFISLDRGNKPEGDESKAYIQYYGDELTISNVGTNGFAHSTSLSLIIPETNADIASAISFETWNATRQSSDKHKFYGTHNPPPLDNKIYLQPYERGLRSVFYCKELSLYVGGYSKNIFVSRDLYNWEIVHEENYVYADHICYGQGKLVVTGGAGSQYIAYSEDGYNWIEVNIGKSIGGNITYSEEIDLFVICGTLSDTVHYSSDLINWTTVSLGFSFDYVEAGVINSTNVFVGVGYNNIIYSSPDAITWTDIAPKNYFEAYSPLSAWKKINYNKVSGIWVINSNGFIMFDFDPENQPQMAEDINNMLGGGTRIGYIGSFVFCEEEDGEEYYFDYNIIQIAQYNSNSIMLWYSPEYDWAEELSDFSSDEPITYYHTDGYPFSGSDVIIFTENYIQLDKQLGIDIDLRKKVDEKISSAKSSFASATLDADNWVGSAAPFIQAVTIAGMTANKNVLLTVAQNATISERAASRNAILYITGQSDEEITITADGEKPAIDIPITIVLLG